MLHRFSDFSLDDERLELRRGGSQIEVQPKVLALLLYLVRHRDRAVAKSELLETLWPDVTVLEDALTVAVHAARAAVGDSGRKQWAIKTLPRRGYRFVAETTTVRTGTAEREPSAESDPFVGRDRALAKLWSELEGVRAGRGCVALLEGEPGIGKTRLAQELMRRAGGSGIRTALGTCHEAGGAPPFWPWVQVLRVLTGAGDVQALLAELGPGGPDAAMLAPASQQDLSRAPEVPLLEAEQARFRLFDAVATLLRNASVASPTLVVLDDLHWADRSSLRLLGHLAREIHGMPVMIVAAIRDARPEHDGVLQDTLAEIARQSPGARIGLQGLARDEVQRLLEAMLERAPGDDLLSWVAERTDGNPFFVKEIVGFAAARDASLGADGAMAAFSGIPPGVRDVIMRRLRPLSPAGQQLLATAAVIGRDAHVSLAERASGLGVDAFRGGLEELIRTGLLAEHPSARGSYCFGHALIRETVYAGLGAIERMQLHAATATAIEELHGESSRRHLSQLVHHCLEAGPYADPDRAIEYSLRASELATELRAYDEAVEHCDRALEVLADTRPADDVRRCDLLLARGWAEAAEGESHRQGRSSFVAAAEVARRIGAPPQLALAALGAAGINPRLGLDDDELVAGLREALEALGDERSTTRAQLLVRLSLAECRPGRFDACAVLAERAVDLAEGLDDPRTLGEAYFARSVSRAGPQYAGEHLAMAEEIRTQAERSGHVVLRSWAHRWRLTGLLEQGDIPALDAEIRSYARFVEEARLPIFQWYLTNLEVMRALLDGRLAEAEGLVLGLLPRVQAAEDPTAFSFVLNQMAWLRRMQGRMQELAPLLDGLDEDQIVPVARTTFRAGMAAFYVELDREEDAHRTFERCASQEFRDLAPDFTYTTTLAFLAETAAYLGDRPRAEALYRLLAPHDGLVVVSGQAGLCLASVARYLGILAQALDRPDDAVRHFERDLEIDERMSAHPWVAYARLSLAEALHARAGKGDGERARRLALESSNAAEELGMPALSEKARVFSDLLRGAIPLRARRRS